MIEEADAANCSLTSWHWPLPSLAAAFLGLLLHRFPDYRSREDGKNCHEYDLAGHIRLPT